MPLKPKTGYMANSQLVWRTCHAPSGRQQTSLNNFRQTWTPWEFWPVHMLHSKSWFWDACLIHERIHRFMTVAAELSPEADGGADTEATVGITLLDFFVIETPLVNHLPIWVYLGNRDIESILVWLHTYQQLEHVDLIVSMSDKEHMFSRLGILLCLEHRTSILEHACKGRLNITSCWLPGYSPDSRLVRSKVNIRFIQQAIRNTTSKTYTPSNAVRRTIRAREQGAWQFHVNPQPLKSGIFLHHPSVLQNSVVSTARSLLKVFQLVLRMNNLWWGRWDSEGDRRVGAYIICLALQNTDSPTPTICHRFPHISWLCLVSSRHIILSLHTSI
jgi:hypothetical protein